MTRTERAGMILRTSHDHAEMAEFIIQASPEKTGYWAWVACEFRRPDLDDGEKDGQVQGHWLAPDTRRPGMITHQPQPYAWPDWYSAEAAKAQWERQQK